MTATGPKDPPGLQTGRGEDRVGPLLAMLAVQAAVSFLSRIAPTPALRGSARDQAGVHAEAE